MACACRQAQGGSGREGGTAQVLCRRCQEKGDRQFDHHMHLPTFHRAILSSTCCYPDSCNHARANLSTYICLARFRVRHMDAFECCTQRERCVRASDPAQLVRMTNCPACCTAGLGNAAERVRAGHALRRRRSVRI